MTAHEGEWGDTTHQSPPLRHGATTWGLSATRSSQQAAHNTAAAQCKPHLIHGHSHEPGVAVSSVRGDKVGIRCWGKRRTSTSVPAMRVPVIDRSPWTGHNEERGVQKSSSSTAHGGHHSSQTYVRRWVVTYVWYRKGSVSRLYLGRGMAVASMRAGPDFRGEPADGGT